MRADEGVDAALRHNARNVYLKYSPPYGFLYTSSCSTAKYENEKKMPAHAMPSCTGRGSCMMWSAARATGFERFLSADSSAAPSRSCASLDEAARARRPDV